MKKGSHLRVALLVSSALGYSRNVLRGIKSYAAPDRGWVCHYADPLVTPFEQVAAWEPAGVIASVVRPELVESLARLGVPVVNVSSALADESFPRVSVEHRATGRIVARYFLDRGFSRFAYVGRAGRTYSADREAGFSETVTAAGKRIATYQASSARADHRRWRSWSELDHGLREWIAELERPVAVMSCDDWQGMQVAETCRHAGLRVPEDVAIVGVDNDDLICDLSMPPLSSVAVPGERVGYEAAALLDRMLACGRAARPPRGKALPPIGVVTRRSSDVLPIEDAAVAAGVRFIRTNAHRPITVDELLREVGISRRSLERRFRLILGRTPLEEVRHTRVERARQLLAGTDLSMPAVARRSGFASAERLSVLFRKETGITPTGYRRQFRLHEHPDE